MGKYSSMWMHSGFGWVRDAEGAGAEAEAGTSMAVPELCHRCQVVECNYRCSEMTFWLVIALFA